MTLMSDENENDKSRRLIVEVQKSPDDIAQLQSKADYYDNFVTRLAERLDERHNTDVFTSGLNLDDPNCIDRLRKLDEELEAKSQPIRKPSTGVVSLNRPKGSDSLLKQEFDTPEEMMSALYQHALNPKSEHRRVAWDTIDRFWQKLNEAEELPKRIMLDPMEYDPELRRADYRTYTRVLRKRTERGMNK